MTTRQTGSIIPLEGQRYRVRWFDPILSREKGKRVYPSEIIHGSKRDAQRLLRQRLTAIENGVASKPTKQSVWQWVDSWLTEVENSESVRPRTAADYRALLTRHIGRTALGSLPLSKLTEGDIARHYSALRSPPSGTGLSPRTIHIIHALLNKSLKRAVRRGLIPRNPAEDVELPRKRRQEMRALTDSQTAVLLAKARTIAAEHRDKEQTARTLAAAHEADRITASSENRYAAAMRAERSAQTLLAQARYESVLAATAEMYYALWLLLVTTGMRPSEALALKWDDLQGENVHVQRSVCWIGSNWSINEPKTSGSRRTIPIPKQLQEALSVHQINQTTAIEQCSGGASYERLSFIFADRTGHPLDPKNLKRRHFKPLLVAAGLPDIRLYDLRHTMATALMAHGVNPKVAAERLGHSSIKQTLETYSHVLPTMQQHATETLVDAFGLAFTAEPLAVAPR